MIYLDYSATTPISSKIMDRFYSDSFLYVGNANSPHKLGKLCFDCIEKTSEKILSLLNLDNSYEVIYTSGSTEANNLLIKGVLNKQNKKHIITTSFEHPSVIAPISYFQKRGFTVDVLKIDENGLVDLNHLKSLVTDDTALVSIVSVNSEIGIKQPINEIEKIVHAHKDVVFHSDVTQSIGKMEIDLKKIDAITFSGHKIYGLKGIGALVKKKSVQIEPQILGGKSTTKYRSGTPMHPLIMSLGNALEEVYLSLNDNYNKVKKLYSYLVDKLSKVPNIVINANEYCIKHILNISILGKNSLDTVMYLSAKDIYISNHSACSSEKNLSLAVLALTNDEERARTSVRISLSHLTTINELDELIKALEEYSK